MYSFGILFRAAAETVRISAPTIWDEWRGRVDPRICDARLESWASNLLAQANISVETAGREHVVPGESFVVLSNHQSHYDIPAAFAAFGPKLRMVAKTELFRIPIMGSAMRASGFVELDRSNRRQAVATLKAARERMCADGTSVWIAPEGTRSVTARLGKFKRGGFYMALDAKLRILPMAIDGTFRAHAPGSRHVNPGCQVRVTLCPPVDPREYGRGRVPT